MKTAIIVGHTKRKQGAKSPYLSIPTEWRFNKLVAQKLQDVATVFYYDSYNTGYTGMVKRMAKQINREKFDLVLELHFNASESPQANGCEALYYFKNESAKALAGYFCELIEEELKIKNRGAKPLHGKSQRGFAAVYYPEATTLILEPFFGSNAYDCVRMNSLRAIDTYVQIIKNLIKVYRNDH
ncbi:N-acetylmuramoyl-L-alanine amidase [Aquimarina algiphila]|uniref:N-acetylmuramoyl-L-alanine amidase n=1 Tax=Aquimarina algiphila TaxID=2047982 RepID=UPI00232B817A|nr:N-acetylmuramoyl-L-alanine amidase [Aquimarina algiphila]